MMNHDLYQETTNRIVEAIESGVTPPWVKPWSLADMQPRNAVTHRVYRGINNLLLVLAANARGYQQSRWLTFHQAAELGGQVRSGEHGIRVVFYKQHSFTEAGTEAGDIRSFPVLRCFTVFNVSQVGGLPDTCLDVPRPATWNGHFIGEALMSASGADIQHGSTHAYYNRPTDIIHMPTRYTFVDQGSYYATTLHELTHWSGTRSAATEIFEGVLEMRAMPWKNWSLNSAAVFYALTAKSMGDCSMQPTSVHGCECSRTTSGPSSRPQRRHSKPRITCCLLRNPLRMRRPHEAYDHA